MRNGLRIIVTFADGLGKNRYIALLDWLSQGTLAPLHHVLIEIISLQCKGTDFTHDQFSSIAVIQDFYNRGYEAFCFDLSAATDRLPILLESKAIQCCGLSEAGCNAWKNIMVGEAFFSVSTGTFVRYSVGQGIGAYSS
jgi:hypothetical protein